MNEAVKRIQEYDIHSPDFLDLSNLHLDKVPELRYGITKLDISFNDIKELNSLPTSLTTLNCSHNRIKSVDISYLDKLQSLNCSNNSISKLRSIPSTLAYLNISDNNLDNKPIIDNNIVLIDYNNRYNKEPSECLDLDFYFIASKDNVLVRIGKEYLCYKRQDLSIFLEDYDIDEEGWKYLKSRYYSIYNLVKIGDNKYSVMPYRSSEYIEL
jgi:hypothetical protein